MTQALINFNAALTSGNPEWNDVTALPSNMLMPDGVTSTGWSILSTESDGAGGSGASVTTGDAAWVSLESVSVNGRYSTSAEGAYKTTKIGGLDNTKTYTIYCFSSGPDGRVTQWQINSETPQNLANGNGAGGPNASNIVTFSGVSPVSGQIDIKFAKATGSGTAYANAVRITEDAGPSVTLDAPPTYGATISGTYENFSGVPAASNNLSITDGTRTITVAVTVTDNGNGTGSFTGTMPSLPTAGNSVAASSLLYPGSVDVTLTDPGV